MTIPAAMLIYVLAMIASRFALRHRDCVSAAEDRADPRGRLGRATRCLLPQGLMELGPFVEYMLRTLGWLSPGVADALALPATMLPGGLAFAAGTILAAVASRQLAGCWREDRFVLCTSGLYGVVRHPMYAGYLVRGVGCGLMLAACWSWALYALAAALIVLQVAAEDRELAARDPEAFAAHRARVRRLVPFVF
jgi:protein-S-isoprenylcysteine O-methyltransferase Ste14